MDNLCHFKNRRKYNAPAGSLAGGVPVHQRQTGTRRASRSNLHQSLDADLGFGLPTSGPGLLVWKSCPRPRISSNSHKALMPPESLVSTLIVLMPMACAGFRLGPISSRKTQSLAPQRLGYRRARISLGLASVGPRHWTQRHSQTYP